MLGFEKIATEYAKYSVSQFNAAKYLVEFIKKNNLIEPSKILDIGCASGVNFNLLFQEFDDIKQICGVDISKMMIDLAGHAFKNNQLVELINEDFEELKLSQQYDLIFCNSMIYYINSYDVFLDKCASALAEGGALAIQYQTSVCPQFLKCFDWIDDNPRLEPYFKNYKFPAKQPSYKAFEDIIIKHSKFYVHSFMEHVDIKKVTYQKAFNIFESSAMIPFVNGQLKCTTIGH